MAGRGGVFWGGGGGGGGPVLKHLWCELAHSFFHYFSAAQFRLVPWLESWTKNIDLL